MLASGQVVADVEDAVFIGEVALTGDVRPVRGVLPALGPMGRMGLTTYLTQSVFGLALFYGIGLGMLGKIGVAWSVALGIGFFVLQVFVSQWWLRR